MITASTGSGGLSHAIIGGIAGGVVGGLCLVGAVAIFFVLRGRSDESPPAGRVYDVELQNNDKKGENDGQNQSGNINDEEFVSGRTII